MVERDSILFGASFSWFIMTFIIIFLTEVYNLDTEAFVFSYFIMMFILGIINWYVILDDFITKNFK